MIIFFDEFHRILAIFSLYIIKGETNMRKENKEKMVKPTNDHAFKWLMGEKQKGGKERLIHLLENILNKDIVDISYLDTHLKSPNKDASESFLDIRVMVNNEDDVNVEMQVVGDVPGLKKRMILYMARRESEEVKSGTDYRDTTNFKSIFFITEGWPFSEEGYVERYYLMTKKGKLFDQMEEYIIVNLKQFDNEKKPYEEMNGLDEWCHFLLHCDEDDEIMVRLRQEKDILKGAEEAMRQFNSDIARRQVELERDRRESDMVTIRNAAREAGEAEARASIATNLIRMGMEPGMVAQATGLNEQELETLKKELA